MKLTERVTAFQSLGKSLQSIAPEEFKRLCDAALWENGWFIESSVKLALSGLGVLLEPKALEQWSNRYPCEHVTAKTVGVASAGNIPLVGFHDFLSVLITGHQLRYKPSSRDTVLPEFILGRLSTIEPRFADRIVRSDRLNGVDAIIATGSDNTARYFEYYFRKTPHVLRKNRVSCGIIQGDEPASEIASLGDDVFSYYGLGCRNVATVFVPQDYDVDRLLKGFSGYAGVSDNHKYANNYMYQKTLLMLTQEQFHDNGFLLLRESESLVSPVATLHIMRYQNQSDLKASVATHRNKIQALVSANGWFESSIPLGKAQFPKLDDYADGVDTMKFLTSLG